MGFAAQQYGTQWGEYDYRVISRERVTPAIVELWLEPTGEAVPYRPGQYVLLADSHFRVPQRSYSIANAPRADGLVSILVTVIDGGVTSTWAAGLTEHDDVLLEGPFGTFTTDPARTSPVLLLGGGSGLAPLRALAEALADPEGAPGRDVTLFFSGRTGADAIDRARFEQWSASSDAFEYLVTCTRDERERRHTRIPALMPHEFETLAGVEVFTAGPPGLVAGCEAAAIELGASGADIHTEEFFVDPQPWTDIKPEKPVKPTASESRR